jgi:hypothetical protein
MILFGQKVALLMAKPRIVSLKDVPLTMSSELALLTKHRGLKIDNHPRWAEFYPKRVFKVPQGYLLHLSNGSVQLINA